MLSQQHYFVFTKVYFTNLKSTLYRSFFQQNVLDFISNGVKFHQVMTFPFCLHSFYVKLHPLQRFFVFKFFLCTINANLYCWVLNLIKVLFLSFSNSSIIIFNPLFYSNVSWYFFLLHHVSMECPILLLNHLYHTFFLFSLFILAVSGILDAVSLM